MMNQIKKIPFLSLLILIGSMFFVTSCENVELTDVESFTDDTIEGFQANAIGKGFCLELIFPVTIEFVDESTTEVSSYENLYETIVTFYEGNDIEVTKENKPSLVFPIQVLNEEGEIIEVASQDELKELKKECPRSGRCKGKRGKGFSCFSLVFPITVTIDDVDITFDTKEALRTAIRTYKEEAGSDAERPTLVYPITVEFEDETQETVESQEELQALKESCKEDN